MKRKLVKAIIAIICVLALTSCGTSWYVCGPDVYYGYEYRAYYPVYRPAPPRPQPRHMPPPPSHHQGHPGGHQHPGHSGVPRR